jgi:hypothetical protein
VAVTFTPTNCDLYIDGILSGSISGNFSIPNDTSTITSIGYWGGDASIGMDGNIDDFRIYNVALSSDEVAQLYAYERSTSPQDATGTAILNDGFVVGVSITDGGYGYTNTPTVMIIGGGGSGAQALATVSNGIVTSITVTDAGTGYTSAPQVVIDPPIVPNPVLGIAPMSFLTFSNLTVSGGYQLQQFVDYYWANLPISFTATNAIYSQMVAGLGGTYRLALNPVPAQAFATPEVVDGFVVGATITAEGSGYVTTPNVNIIGDFGSNVTAMASISGGSVTNITITDAGIGYTAR